MWDLADPFAAARAEPGALLGDFGGEAIALILRYKEVRSAASDWQTFSSDTPFRVPIPSEEASRRVRQLPIETDPPQHTAFRVVLQPLFSRPRQPEMIAKVEALVADMLDAVVSRASFDVINDFAFPLQTKALALLLGVPMSEAAEWQGWGIQVLQGAEHSGTAVEDYVHRQLDRAEATPGDDFFSLLVRADIDGRRLTRDEMLGYALLAFAGGRDTVISTTAFAMAHLASAPDDRKKIRDNGNLVRNAVEEVVRVVSPLTMIGRTCTHGQRIHAIDVAAGQRVALCWASANRDPDVFEDPLAVKFDRSRNAHVGFGAGHHMCLGASHARLVLRSVISALCSRDINMQILDMAAHYEEWPAYRRQTGYRTLLMSISDVAGRGITPGRDGEGDR